MGIGLTDDHRELSGVARDFLATRKARWAARELLDATDETRPPFWQEVADLGWLGLHVPEEFGGSGYGLPELVVLIEELGRVVAPGPFVPTVVASALLSSIGSPDQRTRLLPGLIDGSVAAGIGLVGDLEIAGNTSVSGDAGVVSGAGLADLLVLVAGDDVVTIERTRPGVSVVVPANIDPTRRSGRVTLDNVAITSDDIVRDSRSALVARARTLFAAEAAGGALDCLNAAIEYAKVRQQFGRTIATFQAIKHHCANMAVAAEAAVSAVWDAARAESEDETQFELMAAVAATLAFPAYVTNAQLNIQVHGGIGFTWEHDAHLHLRRALTTASIVGGDGPATDVYAFTVGGVVRDNSLDLPPEAEELRATVRDIATELAALDDSAQLDRLIDTGYVMPHWPKPWGRAADAVEQLVIDEEFTVAGVSRPEYSITGWVILTLIQHGTQDQIDRFVEKALRGEEIWCQLFSEPDAGSDAAAVKTRALRVEGGWKINGQKVWTSGAHRCARGLATVRTDTEVRKHAGITTVIIDMHSPGVEVRPLRQITGESDFNEVFFTDLFIPDADVVGEPNAGWTVARATLGNERVSIGGGVPGAGVSGAELLESTGTDLRPDSGTTVRVGRFLADEHALRLLNLRSAARSIEGAGPGPEGNITKLLLAEHVSEGAAIGAAFNGPATALVDGDTASFGIAMLSARGMSIAGGTSEVTRNQIAERILGLPRDPLIR